MVESNRRCFAVDSVVSIMKKSVGRVVVGKTVAMVRVAVAGAGVVIEVACGVRPMNRVVEVRQGKGLK